MQSSKFLKVEKSQNNRFNLLQADQVRMTINSCWNQFL